MTYAEKLQDPRWREVRALIIEAAGHRCEDCGEKKRRLQVHHCAYASNREPWEYGQEILMALCAKCHKARQEFENAYRFALGKITRLLSPKELEAEVWRILEEVSLRETERLSSSFS